MIVLMVGLMPIEPIHFRRIKYYGGKAVVKRGPRETYFKIRIDGRWYDLVHEPDRVVGDFPDRVIPEEEFREEFEGYVNEFVRLAKLRSDEYTKWEIYNEYFKPKVAVRLYYPVEVEFQLVVKNESSETTPMWGMVFDLGVSGPEGYYPCPLAVHPSTGRFEVWIRHEYETRTGRRVEFGWDRVIRAIWGYYYESKLAEPGDILVLGPIRMKIYDHDPLIVFLGGRYPTPDVGDPEIDYALRILRGGMHVKSECEGWDCTDMPIVGSRQCAEGPCEFYRDSWIPFFLIADDRFC